MTEDATPRRVLGCLLPLLTVAFGLLFVLLGLVSYVLPLLGPWNAVKQCNVARGHDADADLGPVSVTRHFLPAGLTCHWEDEPGVTTELVDASSTWWAFGLVVVGVAVVAVPVVGRFAPRA
jgi:hypothetical protein